MRRSAGPFAARPVTASVWRRDRDQPSGPLAPAGTSRRERGPAYPSLSVSPNGSFVSWRGWDLNPRPTGYEPVVLPNCTTSLPAIIPERCGAAKIPLVNPSAIFPAATCVLLALTGCGTAAPHAHAVPVKTITKIITRTIKVKMPGPVKTVEVTVTASPAPGAAAPTTPSTPAFTCTVMDGAGGATGLDARIWGPLNYQGPVSITFSDGSSDVFPGMTASISGGVAWVPIPTADVGASAEPSQCSASS